MSAPRSLVPLVGRARESRRLGELIDQLHGRGGTLLVRGEAGIGKSALLREASSRAAEHGMLILSATGVESEAQPPFAGLYQLLAPVRAHVEELPGPQRDALLSAFGIVDAPAADRSSLLLITGGQDHTVPESVTRATLKQYRHSDAVTDLLEFPDRAHSLTIDAGWREVADAVLIWLDKQNLSSGPTAPT